MTCAVVLIALLLHVCACNAVTLGDAATNFTNPADIRQYGPVTFRTALAVKSLSPSALALPQISTLPSPQSVIVPFGSNSNVTLFRSGLNELYIAFHDNEPLTAALSAWPAAEPVAGATTGGGGGPITLQELWSNTAVVPFLHTFVPTAAAPVDVVNKFNQLVISTSPTGVAPLTQAVLATMQGERVLQLTCTGEGAGGGLAILCGMFATLHFPQQTNVNVITFNTQWTGFNPQIAWTFDRLVALYYLWPFSTLSPVDTATAATARETPSQQFGAAVNSFITKQAVQSAIEPPNLPPTVPLNAPTVDKRNVYLPPGWDYDKATEACYASFANQTYGVTPVCYENTPTINNLGSLVPNPLQPGTPNSACPPIICKTRQALDFSCRAFKNETALLGLPSTVVQAFAATGIVAWNETSKEAIILFKYTEGTRDWASDALVYRTDNLYTEIEGKYGAGSVTSVYGDPQVHSGFYRQFESVAIGGEGAANLTQAILRLTGGKDPEFITISGFSLGGAVAEIAAVWYSYMFPTAHMMVATQGGPKVGNSDFVTWLKASVGQVYKYQFNLDEVPAIPPISGYRTSRNPIWITKETNASSYFVESQDRPELSGDVTTWYDHWCEVFYVPILFNTSSLSVPGWVLSYSG